MNKIRTGKSPLYLGLEVVAHCGIDGKLKRRMNTLFLVNVLPYITLLIHGGLKRNGILIDISHEITKKDASIRNSNQKFKAAHLLYFKKIDVKL